MGQVFIAQSAQSIRDSSWISHFWPDKPKRINKRKSDEFPPVFAEVPKEKSIGVLLPETDGLIADEQTRPMAGVYFRCNRPVEWTALDQTGIQTALCD